MMGIFKVMYEWWQILRRRWDRNNRNKNQIVVGIPVVDESAIYPGYPTSDQ